MSNVAQKLWLPYELKPKYGCLLCGQEFMEHEIKAYEQHVVACSEINEDKVAGMSNRERMKDILAVGDHEHDKWVKKNRKAIIEGRKRM